MSSNRGGPRTEAGLAISRLNALKHGFATKSPIIPGIEDDAEWIEHHASIVASLSPEGGFEELLVRRLADIFWHLDRLTTYEVASIMSNISDTAEDMIIGENYLSGKDELVVPDQALVDEAQYGRLLPQDRALDQIMRYGGYLHRQWIQTLHELEALQARRRGQPAPLARVDFSSPPNLGPRRSTPEPRAALLRPAAEG